MPKQVRRPNQKKQNSNQATGANSAQLSLRWRPPLDVIFSTASLLISAATLALTSPLLLEQFFPAKLVVTQSHSTSTSTWFEVENKGWTTANNAEIEFDSIAKVSSITLKPESGTTRPRPAGNGFTVVYPTVGKGEKFLIMIDHEDRSGDTVAQEFGAVGAFSARSDRGSGVIVYPPPFLSPDQN